MAALTATGVVVVAGKGGVGKTTVTGLLAAAAAAEGRRVLVVELDGKPTLAERLADTDGVEVRHLSAPAMLEEYLRDHGFGRIAKRLAATGVIDVIGTAAPGIDDVVVLGKIRQLEQRGEWDLILVDGPAAGHAVTMLTSPAGLARAVRGGPVRTQADEVIEMLGDPGRCQVVLVTLAETTPVNEMIETIDRLRERVAVRLGPVVVNAVDVPADELTPAAAADAAADPAAQAADTDTPSTTAATDADSAGSAADLRAAAEFRLARAAMQQAELDRVAALDGVEHVVVPLTPDIAVPPPPPDLAPAVSPRPHPPDPTVSPRPNPSGRAASPSLGDHVATADVIVCCGSGGVGKTTTAAVIGLEAVRQGRRVVVVTIDPARRLADALGLPDGLAATPTRLDLVPATSSSPPSRRGKKRSDDGPGMWAMMLDTAAAFDDLVREYAADTEQAERILANPFYRNMASALSGTQEYMAAETLHRLHGDDRFDLVVVDTPPSRQALDFLEAPGVLDRFISHPVFRLLMLPARRGMKVFNLATQPMLRAIGKVVGSDVLADAVAFIQAFAGMESGFRDRARAVDQLLTGESTRYVLVTSPNPESVGEAVWFSERLHDHELAVSSIVVNRIHPAFGDEPASAASAAAEAASPSNRALWENLAHLRRLHEAEIADLGSLVGPAGAAGEDVAVGRVPLLAGDVHDLAGLDVIRGHLFEA